VANGAASIPGGIVADTNSGEHYILKSAILSASTLQILSVKAKAGAVGFIRMLMQDDSGAHTTYFDLVNGVVGGDGNFASGIDPVDSDGYHRCWIAKLITTTTANAIQIACAEASSDVVFAGDNKTVSVYVKDIMLEELSSDYELLEPSTFINSLAIPAVPRFTKDGLLLEGPGTNIFPYSEDFSTWDHQANVTTVVGEADLRGGTDAWMYALVNTTGRAVSVTITADPASNVYTFSMWVKSSVNRTLSVTFQRDDGSTEDKSINITGDDTWHRYSTTSTYDATPGTTLGIAFYETSGLTGDIMSIFGAQLEESSYVTSYIVTDGAAVTRATEAGVADVSGAQWDLDGTGQLGPEKVVNGDFANWTGDDPDNWTVISVGDATSNVTENPSGKCQIISDGTSAAVFQENMAIGKRYRCTVDVTASSLGRLIVGDAGATTYQVLEAVGSYAFDFVAVTVNVQIKRQAACNVTIDNMSVKEVSNSIPSLLAEVLGEDLVTNGDFATGNGGSGDFSGWENRAGHPFETFDADTTDLNCVNTAADTGFGIMGTSVITLIPGNVYKLTFDWTLNSGGPVALVLRENNLVGTPLPIIDASIGATGPRTYYFIAEYASTVISWTCSGFEVDFNLDNVVVEEVLNDSRGTMVVDWTPGASADVDTSNVGMVSTDEDAAGSLLYNSALSNIFKSYDATSACSTDKDWDVNNTLRTIVRWGIDSSNVRQFRVSSMVLGGSLVTGTLVDYDGAYTVDALLQVFVDGTWPQTFKNLKFFNRVLTDAEMEAL
jgi:hypothetical protein